MSRVEIFEFESDEGAFGNEHIVWREYVLLEDYKRLEARLETIIEDVCKLKYIPRKGSGFPASPTDLVCFATAEKIVKGAT